MKFEVPKVTLQVYAALVNKDISQLIKKGAYYTMEEVMPKELLPGVFERHVPENKRLWYNVIDPSTGYVRSTYGHPKSLQTSKSCELRYKPSTNSLSVTCWNSEIPSWNECCVGKSLKDPRGSATHATK